MAKKKDITDAEFTEVKQDGTKIPSDEINANDSLENDLAKFEESTTNFKTEKNPNVTQLENSIDATQNNPSGFLVLQLFYGFSFWAISGLANYIFNYFSKYEIDEDDTKLTPIEKETIKPYISSPKILEWLNKLSPEMIGVIHIGWLMYRKFNKIQKTKKENNAPLKIKGKKK